MTEPHDDALAGAVPVSPRMCTGLFRDLLAAAGTVAFVCSAFTAIASLLLIAYTRRYPDLDAIQSPVGLVARAVLFALLAGVAGACVWYGGRSHAGAVLSPPSAASASWTARFTLCAVLIATALLLGLKVDRYPWAAPDEVHHLGVARNLAVHQSYASGHPDSGLTYFDSFDSVGPAVLVPLALVFEAAGVQLAAARLTMVAFFLALCIGTYFFTRGLFGVWPGVTAVVLLVAAYSSIYLGRTVYGEVPCYMYLIGGLLAWRRALEPPVHDGIGPRLAWGLLAGALVTCAILSKTIVVLVAFSFLGVWAYDRVTYRRIRWPHVVFPCLGGLAVLALWGVIQRLHAPGLANEGGMLAIYQHYLLFGVGGVWTGIRDVVLVFPLAHLAWACVALVSVPVLFRHRYDPPAMTLYLYALFLVYWWFFFTPGQLYRYLWNAYAILAIFSAPWLVWALRSVFRRDAPRRVRAAALVAVLVLAGPGVRWVGGQAVEILGRDEMAPEYVFVNAIAALPPETRLATDVGRVPGVVNFFTNRAVETGADAVELLAHYDVVVTRDSPDLRAALPRDCRVKTAGEFVLLSTAPTTE